MCAVRYPRDVFEEDLTLPLSEDELKRGDGDYGEDHVLRGTLGIARDSAMDHGDAWEPPAAVNGLGEVDFARAVDVDDANIADSHLGGYVDGSDVGRRLPDDVHIMLRWGECWSHPPLPLRTGRGQGDHHRKIANCGRPALVQRASQSLLIHLSRRPVVESDENFQAGILCQRLKRGCDGRQLEEGPDSLALILDAFRTQGAGNVSGELALKVGREVVDICAALEPPPAARAEHLVLAPAVDDHHGREAVAAGQGHLGVLWRVLEKGAAREKCQLGRADGLECNGAFLVGGWDREGDFDGLEVPRVSLV